MIANWILERIHICRRTQDDDDKFSHRVIEIDRSIGMLLEDEMRKFLFASTVLFVEGRDDEVVIRSVFDQILADSEEQKKNN